MITQLTKEGRGASSRIPIQKRLADRSALNELTGCLEWQGYKDAWGYGRVNKSNIHNEELVHRLAWIEANGPIPGGQQVLHKCDNPPCIQPSHLFLGTNHDNVMDRAAKGRSANTLGSGIDNNNAKLNPEKVAEIRADKRSSRVVAAIHGVNKSTILRIRSGRLWPIAGTKTSLKNRPRGDSKGGNWE